MVDLNKRLTDELVLVHIMTRRRKNDDEKRKKKMVNSVGSTQREKVDMMKKIMIEGMTRNCITRMNNKALGLT